MLIVKLYKRPLSAISIGGEKVRITPGVLSTFSRPLADNGINIYAVSCGENSVTFFVDEGDTEKSIFIFSDIISKRRYESISVRKNIGMISISGPELINTPGLLHKIVTPLAKNKINILITTSSLDSDLLFFDYKDTKKAYDLLNNYISTKISIFKKTKQLTEKITEKIAKRIKKIVPIVKKKK